MAASHPLILGHRGLSSKHLENSLEAFRGALAAGMDGFELDVQPTRDGVCMVLHDEDLARTANGSGLLRKMKVAELPPGQSALHDTIETTAGLWLTPLRALEPDFHTVFATAHHLRRLSPFQTVAELLAFACEKAIRMVSPELAESREGLKAVIPPDVADSW